MVTIGVLNAIGKVYLADAGSYIFTTVEELQMNCGEVLRYLLKDRFGTQLVKLSVDLADVDNKASLDLLCTLFKHCECYES